MPFVLLLSAFILFLLFTITNHVWMQILFTHLSYFFLLILTTIWILTLHQFGKEQKFSSQIKRYLKPIVFSLLLAAIVFISVPKTFRVLSDETNLLSVSQSMTFHKTVLNTEEGRRYYEMFWPTETSGVEKRPFLFPFFTSILHTFLGYHVTNVFILNFFSLWAVLFLLFLSVEPYFDQWGSYAALILVISQPFICLCATSGGFEIFNFVFILLCFLLFRSYINNPQSITLNTLIISLVMLANTRYESILYFAVAIICLLMRKYLKPLELLKNPFFAAGLIFLLPWIWQRILLLGQYDSNLHGGSWAHAFGLSNAKYNIMVLGRYIFELTGNLGFAGALDMLGVLGLVYFIYQSFRPGRLTKNQVTLLFFSFLTLGLLFIILIFYQGGIDDHPLNGRFYIPLLVPLSILPLYLFSKAVKNPAQYQSLLLTISLAFFVYYHPVAVEDRLSKTVMVNREFQFIDRFLHKADKQHSLFIYGRPGELVACGFGAINYNTANAQVDNILGQYQNHLFNAIYVIQYFSYKTKLPYTDNIISARYQLDPLTEIQVSGEYYLRISQAKPAV